MNYYIYNYTTKSGENKELKLRLTSGDAIAIEDSKKASLIKYLDDESVSMIVTLLGYLVKNENKKLSQEEAQNLYDELIDSGISMRKILTDIIYESLIVSGFLERKEWEEMKSAIAKMQEKKKELLTKI